MAYTQADLDAVREAIKELSVGKRKVSVRIGDVSVEYNRTSLPDLYELERRILYELSPRPRVVMTTTTKGL